VLTKTQRIANTQLTLSCKCAPTSPKPLYVNREIRLNDAYFPTLIDLKILIDSVLTNCKNGMININAYSIISREYSTT